MMIPVHVHLRQDQIKLLDERVNQKPSHTRASLIRQAVDQMLAQVPQKTVKKNG